MNCPRCNRPGLKSQDGTEFFCLADGSYGFLPATYPDPSLDAPNRGGRRASPPQYEWTPEDELRWKSGLAELLATPPGA